MGPRHFIEMTYQPDTWIGDIHQCEGWIARWEWHEHTFAGWAETRKKAYEKAYRALKRTMRSAERAKREFHALTNMARNIRLTIDTAVRFGVKRKVAVAFAKEACK